MLFNERCDEYLEVEAGHLSKLVKHNSVYYSFPTTGPNASGRIEEILTEEENEISLTLPLIYDSWMPHYITFLTIFGTGMPSYEEDSDEDRDEDNQHYMSYLHRLRKYLINI